MAQRSQVAVLHRVVGSRGITQQVAGKRVDRVEVRQRGVAKAPRPRWIFLCGPIRHRVSFGFTKLGRSALQKTRHGAALSPVAPSTTIVPVMGGCREQKYS